MNIDKIWARHGSNDLWIEADSDGWQAHEDRGVLLERIAKLERENRILRLKLACVHLGQGDEVEVSDE